MFCDSYEGSETCEVLVYMSAKACDPFGTTGPTTKKGTRMEKKETPAWESPKSSGIP